MSASRAAAASPSARDVRPARGRLASIATVATVASLLIASACTGTIGTVVAPGQPLAPCPSSPNCVTSEAAPTDSQHAMRPVPFTDAPAAAQARARAALTAEPRTVITLEQAGYLRAGATSLIFRFVDDVEVVVDAGARLFRFRSASRIGRGDMGVNRARMTRVSERLLVPATGSSAAP